MYFTLLIHSVSLACIYFQCNRTKPRSIKFRWLLCIHQIENNQRPLAGFWIYLDFNQRSIHLQALGAQNRNSKHKLLESKVFLFSNAIDFLYPSDSFSLNQNPERLIQNRFFFVCVCVTPEFCSISVLPLSKCSSLIPELLKRAYIGRCLSILLLS